MKRKVFYLLAFVAAFVANAQVVVYENSRIEMGKLSADALALPVADRDTLTMLSIHGPWGDYGAGAYASFGDHATSYGHNVCVGELGWQDTDRLWLHGKMGFTMTAGAGGDSIAIYDRNAGNFLRFTVDVKAPSFLVLSDGRLKENISPLDAGCGNALRGITPVSYNLKPRFATSTDGMVFPDTEKGRRDAEFAARFAESLKNEPTRFGFIAQEVEEVYPELVHTDADGLKSVDYIGMIPILVSAINDLQAQLDDFRGEGQENAPKQVKAVESVPTEIVAALYQNKPNPFSDKTEIRYSLPSTVGQADIFVYDLQGQQIKRIALNERGEASVTIAGGELTAGMYIYSLIADGQEVATRRMILTK